MSRIGKMPVELDPAVTVTVNGADISVKGPKGTLSQSLPRGITAELQDKQLVVTRRDDSKNQRALHGLARALLANAVHGVHKGFMKSLEIHGVGYAAEVKGKAVNFKLGYSHPVVYPIPAGIEIKVERNKIDVSGCDRQHVGQVAAELRALRPPDVYKLKGIRYADEQLRKKAGKTGAS